MYHIVDNLFFFFKNKSVVLFNYFYQLLLIIDPYFLFAPDMETFVGVR